jgi:glycosyltransferase involved in cell wall biosynthesis
MRILIISPTVVPSVTGNAVTVERWRKHLAEKGHTVRTVAAEGLAPDALLDLLRSYRPDIIHAHHAVKAAGLLPGLLPDPLVTNTPLVVSLPGTDVYIDLPSSGNGETMTRVCRMAAAVIVQSEEALKQITEHLPDLEQRFVYVPKSVAWLGDAPFDLRGSAKSGRGDILFFFPAGIRPVKRNLECLLLLEKVFALRPATRAVFAGPALDKPYAEKFGKEIARLHEHALWITPVPPQAMQSAYRDTDVVLNASFSEGLSNVLLEAATAGRPVLASDIPANRWPVLGCDGDEPAGLLFDPSRPGDFLQKAITLIDDKALRTRLGEAGQRRAKGLPLPEKEAEHLAAVYGAVLGKGTLP